MFRVGSTCSHDTTAPFTMQCVEGAYCDMPIVNGIMIHRCMCLDGWIMTKQDRLCQRRASWRPISPR